MLIEFPSEFPTEALDVALDAWRSPTTIDRHRAAKCAWNVLGYGLSKGFPHPLMTGAPPTDTEIEAAFAEVKAQGVNDVSSAVGAGGKWLTVLRVVLELLTKLI